jgi:hypothetical protein
MGSIIDKFHSLPNDVKKSVSDQIKLLSWVLGAVNGYFMHFFGNFGGIFFVVLWWMSCQTVAHAILYNINKNNKEEL